MLTLDVRVPTLLPYPTSCLSCDFVLLIVFIVLQFLDHSVSSLIDTFICSEYTVTQFSSIAVCGSGTNLSDHEPLSAVFNASFNTSPFLILSSFV